MVENRFYNTPASHKTRAYQINKTPFGFIYHHTQTHRECSWFCSAFYFSIFLIFFRFDRSSFFMLFFFIVKRQASVYFRCRLSKPLCECICLILIVIWFYFHFFLSCMCVCQTLKGIPLFFRLFFSFSNEQMGIKHKLQERKYARKKRNIKGSFLTICY